MKTYRLSQKARPFNWIKFLEKAKTGKVNEKEIEKARIAAGDWVTCACGNQCATIPRDAFGEPDDYKLASLGLEFYVNICQRKFESAAKTLVKIEKRSIQLINKKRIS